MGKSSAVADDLTATENSLPLYDLSIREKATFICSKNSSENLASRIDWRISLPTTTNSLTSETSRLSSLLLILSPRLSHSKKSRKASAVVAKPPGTRTPASSKCLIISPNEAFLPPTLSTSFIPTSLRDKIYSFIIAYFFLKLD